MDWFVKKQTLSAFAKEYMSKATSMARMEPPWMEMRKVDVLTTVWRWFSGISGGSKVGSARPGNTSVARTLAS